MPHGELTAKMAREISNVWEARGYDVLFDHGYSGETVGKIVSWFGESHSRETQLSQIDIAIVEKTSNNVFALIEIEETNDKPKTFLGDVFGVLLGDHIQFGGKRELFVNENTALFVFGKSETAHKERVEYLRNRVLKIKTGLSSANSKIGAVVIKTFLDDRALSVLLPRILDEAFKDKL